MSISLILIDAPNNRPMVPVPGTKDREGTPQTSYLMKKQKLNLGKKLFLNKEIIAGLNARQQNAIAGGATEGGCLVTQIPNLCNGKTVEYGCTTHSLGIACTVIFCV
jgi:hypothetical protein